jgi:RimJ/RimL family protein N-acetyltransferase
VETGNASSRTLLSRLGFTHEGTHRECERKHGRYISLEYYARLNSGE